MDRTYDWDGSDDEPRRIEHVTTDDMQRVRATLRMDSHEPGVEANNERHYDWVWRRSSPT